MKHISDILRDMGFDARLFELAQRVKSNVPDHRDPERFHREKSEIENELKRIARGETAK